MTQIGLVFPGQGSQRRGMARDVCDAYDEARKVFDRASEMLSLDIFAICNDDDPRLDMTAFTQPCILTAEIALYESLKAHFGFHAELFGGHSLGEYTALVAADAIPFDVAVRLVRSRGELMQEKAPAGMGGMAAIIREELPRELMEKLATEHDIDIANDNSPKQVVVSGEKTKVETFCEKLAAEFAEGDIRIVPLNVSAPFHSRHMSEVEASFRQLLEENAASFRPERAKQVTSNFTGTFHTGDPKDLIDALARQISGGVKWRDNMQALMQHTQDIFEVGPNRPLGGFFKAAGLTIKSIMDIRTAERYLAHTPS